MGFRSKAQTGKGEVVGKLVDSSNNQALALATVTIFRSTDTSIVSYRLSDPEGAFRIPNLPLSIGLRMIITHAGHRSVRKEFELNDQEPLLNMGTVAMAPSSVLLDEVVIVAERPPVIVRNDTIEFNASSFKTLPTALVEDLLRKLPGVQVDRNGDITVNGRRVNRILVDGKAFFGDDPKMATRNLPANLIDKVQVTDDKEEINRTIDNDRTDVGKVINLTFRKGLKRGWFGKAYGGGGTDGRYEGGGIGNIFRDTLQLSILGFSNNINRSGFSMKDVQDLGGFSRSGTNSTMMSDKRGNVGFAINDISFGGIEDGISRVTGAGFNLNHAPNTRNTFHVQYFFGHVRTRLDENSNIQQFFADTVLDTRNLSNTLTTKATHSLGGGLKLKPDSLTDINVSVRFFQASTDNNRFSLIDVRDNKTGGLSTGQGSRLTEDGDRNYNHNLRFNRRFSRIGRMLNINHVLTYNQKRQNIISEQQTVFFPADQPIFFGQLRREEVPNILGSIAIDYTEPLSKRLSMRISQQLEYLKDDREVGIFEGGSNGNNYTIRNEQLSNGLFREQQRSNSTLAFTYGFKAFNFTAGANLLLQNISNEFRKGIQTSHIGLTDVMPTFNFTWKTLSLNYSENVTAPSVSFLNPVADSTNPFDLVEINPDLRASDRKIFRGNYFRAIPQANINYGFFMSGQFINDDVVWERTIDNNGIQVSRPVNADGTRMLMGNFTFSKAFKNTTDISFSTSSSLWINYIRQAIIFNGHTGMVKGLSFSPSASVGLNVRDIVEFRPEYRLFLSQTRYSDDRFTDLYVPTHHIAGEIVVRWPKNIVWETIVLYRRNPQVLPGMPESNLLWNASATFMFFSESKGQMKFSVYDILNRNNSYYRVSSQNYIQDYQSNILPRYFMLTFTYDLRAIGTSRKVGGRDRLFNF